MASELERQLASLNQGDHLCPIFESVAARLAVIVPFIKDGLALRERCVHVADDPTAAEVTGGSRLASDSTERPPSRL